NADRGGKWRYHKECKRDNESLRRENSRLKEELELLRRDTANIEFRTLDYGVPEIRIEAPMPPPLTRVK
ncbi:MAG: hypothetical protein PSX80_09095, partial [bacterium]|nr:hypothetical protein [bacterium]